MQKIDTAGEDPGFPVGGAQTRFWGGCGPPRLVLFDENVCENETIGSHKVGGCAPEIFACRSANVLYTFHYTFVGMPLQIILIGCALSSTLT